MVLDYFLLSSLETYYNILELCLRFVFPWRFVAATETVSEGS